MDLLDEVESDLSRFHRIDDMYEMGAARFFRLVPYLHSYGGAVAAANSDEKGEPPPMAGMPTPIPASPVPYGGRVVGASVAELKLSDIGDLFSIGRSDA